METEQIACYYLYYSCKIVSLKFVALGRDYQTTILANMANVND